MKIKLIDDALRFVICVVICDCVRAWAKSQEFIYSHASLAGRLTKRFTIQGLGSRATKASEAKSQS